MSTATKKNIIWILCDSVRVYPTSSDERGRLDVMDEFATDALDFRTAVTAAPSTIMSVSSMLTGLPSSYISRDYSGFTGQQKELTSFPEILRDHGYSTYALLFLSDARIFLEPIFGDTCKEIMGGDDVKDDHSNDFMLSKFDEFLESDRIKEPFFVWLHLNCRGDELLSSKVSVLLEKLKSAGLYDDSFIVMNSDHGYPDPSRGISYYDKRKYGHDLIMSDDNILAPQLIKIPGVHPKRIDVPISTIDIFPTIIDFLGIPENKTLSNFPKHGESLRPFLEGEKEWSQTIRRTDNRYIFQQNASVSLRNDKYKYIIYNDEQREEFYDVSNDVLESHNLIKESASSPLVEEFRQEYLEQRAHMISFHANALRSTFDMKYGIETSSVLVGEFNQNFIDVYSQVFSGLQDGLIVEIVGSLTVLKCNKSENFATVIGFPCVKDHITNSSIVRLTHSLSAAHRGCSKSFVNYNLDDIQPPRHWIKKAIQKPGYYFRIFKRDPRALPYTIASDLERLARKLL
jgi:hypothetical protein